MQVTWSKKLSTEEQKNMYSFFKKHTHKKVRIWGREQLVLHKRHIEKYLDFFSSPVHLGEGINYRSNRFLRHLHIIVKGDTAQVHYDYGNIYKSYFFSIIHLYVDAFPYFLWQLVFFKKPYDFEN